MGENIKISDEIKIKKNNHHVKITNTQGINANAHQ